MRIFVAASWLLSGSIALVESAGVKIPSSFHDVLRRYQAERDAFLHYSNERISQQMLAAMRSVDANHRDLQTTSPTSAPLCNADESVNFDDDLSSIAYDGGFQPTCSCSEESNQNEVKAALQALFLNVTDSFADDYNTLIGTLYTKTAYMCTNGCESCYKGICGLSEVTKETSVAYQKPNFTAEEILSRQTDTRPFISDFSAKVRNCFEYTSGTTLDGQLCLGVDIDTVAEATSSAHTCLVEYADVSCNSCVVDFTSADTCFVADCTNIDASARIDLCGGTGFVGPFEFLAILNREDITLSNWTVGSCDVMSAPVAIRGATPTGAPIVIADTGGSSLGLFFGGIAVGMALMAVIVFLALRQRHVRRPPSSSSVERQPFPTAATPSETSVVAISAASVDPFPRIRHADSVQDAMPMPTAPVVPVRSPLHAHPPVSYKDQAREHPNVVPISGAWAAEATQPRPRSSKKAEPSGIRHDDEHMDDWSC